MYDMKPLEEKWQKYRNKKLRPWFVAVGVLMIFSILMAVFWENLNTQHPSKSAQLPSPVLVEEKNVSQEANTSKIKKPALLDAALDELQINERIKEKSETKNENPTDILVDVPILEDEEGTDEQAPAERKKIHLDILETTNASAYQDVEKRFLVSRDIEDALFLANSYYDKGNYKKAEYWSIQANKIDSEMEESFLIFVKSKIKLGYKNEGISILKSYIERRNSKEAKKVLQQVQGGIF
jgi:hypothetical protein